MLNADFRPLSYYPLSLWSWQDAIKAVFGVMLLGVAIWMLERILPTAASMMLWGALLITSAVYMGALDKLDIDATGWHKLWKGIGLILLVYGVFQTRMTRATEAVHT